MAFTNITTSSRVAPPPASPRRRRLVSGITLVEVVVTITVFALFVAVYAATFPPLIQSTARASNYLQASNLARHKIEQVRQAGFTKLNGASLKELFIVDSTAGNGNGPLSFAVVDNLVDTGTGANFKAGYFGAATRATGTITIGRALAGQGANAPDETRAKQVTVSITWTAAGAPTGSYETHTVMAP